MATGQADKKKNQEMAERMRKLGIRRKSGRCPICYRIIGIPMDRHFVGGICK